MANVGARGVNHVPVEPPRTIFDSVGIEQDVASPLYPVGIWREVSTRRKSDGSIVVDPNGRPIQRVYELELRGDNTYVASLTDWNGTSATTQTTSGRYSYRAGSDALLPPPLSHRRFALDVDHFFHLDFENGCDTLKLESLTDDEMRIKAQPESSTQPWRKYTLSRVKAGQGPP